VLSWAAAIMPVVLSKLGAAAETPSSPE